MKSYSYSEILGLLGSAKSVLIAIPKGVTFDQIASGLALYLSLQKEGKNVSIACPEPMRVEFSHLVGVDKVKDKVAGSDLAVTFDYPLENIEKVTSNDDGGKLNLIVKIKSGQAPIAQNQINFSTVGADSDLIFVIAARKLEGLGKIYFDNRELFEKKPIVIIDNNPQNTGYGKVNIIDQTASSVTEMAGSIISGANLPIDVDIASNLMLGLIESTNNFQSQMVTADTFEMAALALKSGGRRSNVSAPVPVSVMENPEVAVIKEEVKPEVSDIPKEQSQDWFEPKIYKGSTLP